MTDELQPFPQPDPFDFPVQWSFAGWPTQILFEVQELLADRDSAWLTDVARHIRELVMGDVDRLFDSDTGPSETLAHSKTWPFSLHTQPGHIGVFSALEPGVDWNKLSPATDRWERYAVFALMYIRDCIQTLSRSGVGAGQGGWVSSSDTKHSALALNDAGAAALEAMRALQIAHSLRIDKRSKSASGRKAAIAKHDAMKPKRAKALDMANSRPFKTKREAIDFITDNLVIDEEKQKLCSRRAAGDWLLAAGWQPESKRQKV